MLAPFHMPGNRDTVTRISGTNQESDMPVRVRRPRVVTVIAKVRRCQLCLAFSTTSGMVTCPSRASLRIRGRPSVGYSAKVLSNSMT